MNFFWKLGILMIAFGLTKPIIALIARRWKNG